MTERKRKTKMYLYFTAGYIILFVALVMGRIEGFDGWPSLLSWFVLFLSLPFFLRGSELRSTTN